MKKILFIIIILAVIASGFVFYLRMGDKDTEDKMSGDKEGKTRCGTVKKDERWSGNIYISCLVFVPDNVTLTIEPGTVVKFKYDRNYKTFERAGLSTFGGTILAKGTPDKQIWFTSAADEPINGDWNGIALENSDDSIFDYVIVEFSEMGIEQLDSSATVSNSIIRWVNAEGLYAERSKPVFKNNTLYGNGYHEIALEQYNENVQIINNNFLGGHFAIHHEKTSSLIEGNYFSGYTKEVVSAGMESDVTIKNNTFINLDEERAFNIYDGSVSTILGNTFADSGTPLVFDYKDIKNKTIDYIPGDKEDKFPYVYAGEDETRKVVKRIGKDLYFGWSLLYANDSLWRFSLGSGTVGQSLDFIKVDPDTGKYQLYGNDEIMNPRGLSWDGEFFWVNDFSLLKLFKFKLEGDHVVIVSRYDIPHKDLGGTSGLTFDGTYLLLRSRNGEKLYRIDLEGNYAGDMEFKGEGGFGGSSLVWTGEYFWTTGGCGKGLCKWTKDGYLVGEIYPPAKDAWAIAWDGRYLWTLQRTSELINDDKIFQLEIKNDSLGEQ